MPRAAHPLPRAIPAYKAPEARLAQIKPQPRPADPAAAANAAAAKLKGSITRQRAWALTGACLAGAGIAFWSASLYVSLTRCPHSQQQPAGPQTQAELTGVYDRTARSFDADVNLSERLMGMTGLRKRLAAQCRGDVLEVSSGTARNLAFYRFGVRSLTLVDLSPEMVEQGRRKWEVLQTAGGVKGIRGVPVRFITADAVARMPEPPVMEARAVANKEGEGHDAETAVVMAGGKKGYDTILQSMGLCSTPSPVELLQNLSLHLDRDNPNARILLLEHGRSYYPWLNRILDTQASMHAEQHGCWWNRDIGEIVEKSGLEVVREKRRHFGTTWIFELKPSSKALQEAEKGATGVVEAVEVENEEVTGLGAWLPRWTYEKICRR